MKPMDFAQARFNMVEQQIRPGEVLDQRVLDIMAEVPREDFVPERFRNMAYADTRIQLGHGQEMMTPLLEARLLQSLAIKSTDAILEIGTGSGYLTVCLAKLGKFVSSVEIFPELLAGAQDSINRYQLNRHGIANITLDVGDAAHGWGNHAPYDVIAITGSLPSPPTDIQKDLKVGGRLFAIVGDSPAMDCQVVTRMGEHEWLAESLMETDLPPLINVLQPQRFVF